jgi:serine protease
VRQLIPRALAVIAACLLATLVGRVNAEAPADAEAPFVPGQVVVSLEPGASPQDIGIASQFAVRGTADFVTIAVPAGREREYVLTLDRLPGVLSAELNYLAQPQVIPNDARFQTQWDMPMIQAPQAWDTTRGAGATVAIIDTGVAFEDYGEFARSPELSHTTFVSPWDFTKNDEHSNDDNGHGTHVTGTIAQDWNDGIGVAGLAPDAAIMPVKVCLATGCPGDMMAAGIRWAVDHGADVINMSLGGPTLPLVERQALAYAEQHGVVVVAAAGNGSAFVGGSSLDYPAKADTVIAAGAVDLRGKRTPYSNYGQHEHDGGLLIMAPGGDLHVDLNDDGNADGILQSTYAFSCLGGPRDYTQFADCFFQGTSMAAPHVSGTVALLLSRFPDLTPVQVRAVLACAAKDAGAPGVDEEDGVGVVQAATAIMDNDQDGVPDCLEARAQLTLTVGGGTVRPGDFITVPLDGASQWIITSFAAQVTASGTSLTPVDCEARAGAICSIEGQSIRIVSDGDAEVSGSFRLGELTFEATEDVGQSTLVVAGSATISDDLDPPVQVNVQNSTAVVKQVPDTVIGDVNCDGKVTVSDVTVSLGFSLGVSPAFCWRYGDIDCSGLLEATDALALLDYLSDIGSGLPAGCPN